MVFAKIFDRKIRSFPNIPTNKHPENITNRVVWSAVVDPRQVTEEREREREREREVARAVLRYKGGAFPIFRSPALAWDVSAEGLRVFYHVNTSKKEGTDPVSGA